MIWVRVGLLFPRDWQERFQMGLLGNKGPCSCKQVERFQKGSGIE